VHFYPRFGVLPSKAYQITKNSFFAKPFLVFSILDIYKCPKREKEEKAGPSCYQKVTCDHYALNSVFFADKVVTLTFLSGMGGLAGFLKFLPFLGEGMFRKESKE
jgi:hypothetical protein